MGTERHGFVGLRFVVQSERSVTEVAQRVRSWSEGAWQYLMESLTSEEFERYRASLIAQLRERPKSLNEEFGRNWSELANRSFSLKHREQIATRLEDVSLADLQMFSSEKLRVSPALCILIKPSCSSSSEDAVAESFGDRK